LCDTVSVSEMTRFFNRAGAATAIFQLDLSGREPYRQACIYSMCDLRGLPCALLRPVGVISTGRAVLLVNRASALWELVSRADDAR
jgi:hypothetical protein